MKIASVSLLVASFTWAGLWFTPQQQGQRCFDRGDFESAAELFRDPMRIGAAWFRAGEFKKAEAAFARGPSANAEYNRGNCLVMMGKYETAVGRYDAALKLRPDWDAAKNNREIAASRAKLLEQKGGDMGDQKIGADEIRFDGKKSSEGQETTVTDAEAMSDASMQSLWLRRVQTKPADFLRAKFAFQLNSETDQEK